MFNILFVEDDKNTRKLFSVILKNHNFTTLTACDGIMALDIINNNHVDLAIVDIMMPKMNGLEFIKTIRSKNNNLPIIVVSARSECIDRKEAFLAGTDDYITKPIDEDELILRIKALERRYNISTNHLLKVNNLTLNYDNFSIESDNGTINFTKKEFLILFKLLSYPNKIFTKYDLMKEFWGYDSITDDHTINVHINRLRTKTDKLNDFSIVNVRGLGYKAVINEEKE